MFHSLNKLFLISCLTNPLIPDWKICINIKLQFYICLLVFMSILTFLVWIFFSVLVFADSSHWGSLTSALGGPIDYDFFNKFDVFLTFESFCQRVSRPIYVKIIDKFDILFYQVAAKWNNITGEP